jgi:RNA polymerase sigma-70 factor, ECF subfamily
MPDAALVGRVLDGDTRAFTALVDRHGPDCLRFATRMLGNREDAEDATQEALLRAYRSLGTFDERASFRTWLFAIVVNQCRTLAVRRERRRRRIVTDESAVARAVYEPESRAAEAMHDLERALAVLDVAHREAFLLKHVEQLEYTEIAAMTGVGVSALKMRVKRACARLQQALGDVADVRP